MIFAIDKTSIISLKFYPVMAISRIWFVLG